MADKLTITGIAKEVEARIGVKPVMVANIIRCIGEIAEDEIAAGRTFTFPNVATVSHTYSPSKPKRKGRNPFTGEDTVFKAKPAEIKVKARPQPAMRRAVPSTGSKVGKAIAAAKKK